MTKVGEISAGELQKTKELPRFNFVFKKKGERELNHIFDREGRSWVKYGMVTISSTLETESPGFS